MVDAYYLEIIKCGIETLAKYYYSYSEVDMAELQDKLSKIAEWSKPSVPLLLEVVQSLEAEIVKILEEKMIVSDKVLSKSFDRIDKIKHSLPSSKSTQNN